MTAGNTPTPVLTAERCPVCGRRAVENGKCGRCGQLSPQGPTFIAPVTRTPAQNLNRVGETSITAALFPTAPARPVAVSRATVVRYENSGGLFERQIGGRILYARQGPSEPMDMDLWLWVAVPAWGMVLLLSPLLVGILVWMFAGFLAALALALAFFAALRFIFSARLFYGWQFIAAMRGRQVVEPMPILAIRLRLPSEREVQLRMKGHVDGGMAMEGDRISAWGKWRGGVFRVNRIFCERTGATMTPKQPNSFVSALVGMGVLLTAALWLFLAGVPWTQEQVRSFEGGIHQRAAMLAPSENQRISQ